MVLMVDWHFQVGGGPVVVILRYKLTILAVAVIGKRWWFGGSGEHRFVVAHVVMLGPLRIDVSLHIECT